MSASPDSLTAQLPASTRDLAATPEATLEPVVVEDFRPTLWESLRESWRSKHVLWALAMNSLMAFIIKYRLGPFWIVFSTLMGVFGWALIFGGKIAGSSAERDALLPLHDGGDDGLDAFPEHTDDHRARIPAHEVADPRSLLPADHRADRGLGAGAHAVRPAAGRLHDLRSSTTGSPRATSTPSSQPKYLVTVDRRALPLRRVRVGDQPLDCAADRTHARRPHGDPLRRRRSGSSSPPCSTRSTT